MKRKILSLMLAVSMVMCLFSGVVNAEAPTSGQCGDDITWQLNNGVLTLNGTGATYNYSADDDYTKNPPPWFEGRGYIRKIVLSEGITDIGAFALVGCVNVREITLPSTLKTIGERAFMDWINLVEIEIPQGVTSIGEGAFEWNDKFTKVTIYDGVTDFGNGVFEACANLTVYGLSGSGAEAYAAQNSIPFVAIDGVTQDNKIVLTIGKQDATVFGSVMTNDVAPIIRNDRTMLPARFVAEKLGATVDWYAPGQTVIITRDDVQIIITIGSIVASVNGEYIDLDSPAFIENDRTYTPVRFIVENLGATVDWNGETKQVTITK